MHPLASYLTAVDATSDHGVDDDDLRTWAREQQAIPARDETPTPKRRRIVSILEAGIALLSRRSARSMGRLV